jgi:hypothetical protein
MNQRTYSVSVLAMLGSAGLALGASACGSEGGMDVASNAEGLGAPSCAGSSSGTAGATGNTGAGGAASSDDASTPIADAKAPRDAFVPGPPYVAPAHQGLLVSVLNNCKRDLWIHAEGGGGVLMPDNLKLSSGQRHDYVPPDWPFAWVSAYADGPQQGFIERAEMTLVLGVMNYRLQYIDGIGLPLEVVGVGSGDDCKRAGCYVPESDIAASCPDGLYDGKRCQSAGAYCAVAANQSKPFCHALDQKIASCAQSQSGCQGAQGATTPQAYDCDKFFGGNPKWCAALNRGMLESPDNPNGYLSPPFNTYAAWLHDLCPGIYAFPYDDYANTNDTFHTCRNGGQINVTFCPAG